MCRAFCLIGLCPWLLALVAGTDATECISESLHAVGGTLLLQRAVMPAQMHIESGVERRHSYTHEQDPSLSDQPTSLQLDLEASKKALDARKPTWSQIVVQGAVPKVAFLFLLTQNMEQEGVWDAFFEQAQEEQYSIYMHRASTQQMTTVPLSKWGSVLVPQVPTRWGALLGAEIALFREALLDQANVQFVLLSGTTVPLKPFHYVHSQLASRSPDTSKLCFQHTQESPAVNLKHHQWLILSRQHTLTFLENAESAIRMTYSALQGIGAGCCSDELAVSIALLLDQVTKEPSRDWSALDKDLKAIGVEKSCLTWVSWYDHLNGTPLDLVWWYESLYSHNGTTLNGAPHHFGPPESDPTVKLSYLQTLVTQEGFMFGRKFNSGCSVDTGTEQLPLSTELPRLWEQVNAQGVSSRVWSRLDGEGAPK